MKKMLKVAGAASIIALHPSISCADFFKDSKASLELRNFYFDRDFRNGPPTAQRDSAKEWAQGFIARYESGYTRGIVGLGLDLTGLVGLKLDGGDGSGGTGLLPAQLSSRNGRGSQDEYSKAQVTGKLKISETVLKTGSVTFRSPIASNNDTRLLPSSFRGTTVTSKDVKNLTLFGGQLDAINFTSSTDYQDFTANRIGGSSDKFSFGGGVYNFTKDTTVSLYYSNLDGIYNQYFAGATYLLPIDKDQSIKLDGRFFKTKEDGRFRDLDNKAVSVQGFYVLGGNSFGAAYQKMSGDDPFPYIGSSDPYLVNFVQINDFANTHERSWQVRYDYNFAAIGVPGLTFMTRYVSGDNVLVSGSNDGREWERDTDVGYIIQTGTFKNLGLKLRNATVRSTFGNDLDETRLIASYTIPLW